ncbi:MAG: GNAT family N-acetyltransferase [Candidatus Binataceae bacterium]
MRKVRRAPAVKIRTARAADLPALAGLYAQLHLNDYSYRTPAPAVMRGAFRAIAHRGDHRLLVAESGGEIVGTLHVMIFRHLGHGMRPVAIVENVVVSDAMRSRGVGRALMEAAGKIARRNRCYKMSLTSNVARRRAHRFYERLGWRRTHFGYSTDLE